MLLNNLLQLVRNEQVKLYAKKSTWIMLSVLVAIILLITIFSKVGMYVAEEQTGEDNWKQELREQNKRLQENQESAPEIAKSGIQQQIGKNQYRIANDIPPKKHSGLIFVREIKMLTALVSLLTIIVAAGIVANEFKLGTIKLLLIRPVSRTKILIAKYITVVFFALTTLVLLLISSFVFGTIFFGWERLNTQILVTDNGDFFQANLLNLILTEYSLEILSLVIMPTLAFMLSSIFRSSSLSIGIAVFLLMTGKPIMTFLAKYEWSKFLLFANTNLNQHFTGTPFMNDMTLTFSMIVLFLYYFVFLFFSWFSFVKRDVAGN